MVFETAIVLFVVTLMVFIFVTAIVGRVVFSVVGTVFRAVLGGGGAPPFPRHPLRLAASTNQCARDGCGAPNPPEARFCRRCGSDLAQANRRRAISQQAAMW